MRTFGDTYLPGSEPQGTSSSSSLLTKYKFRGEGNPLSPSAAAAGTRMMLLVNVRVVAVAAVYRFFSSRGQRRKGESVEAIFSASEEEGKIHKSSLVALDVGERRKDE